MRIHKHIDLDDLSCVTGDHDARASLLALANATYRAIRAEYPNADVDVTFDARTGGSAYLSVCDDDGNECDWIVTDRIREVAGTVWERHDWVVRPTTSHEHE